MCRAEAERARQLKYDELQTRKKDNNSTANQPMVQILELQDKVTSLNDAKEFYDPETASSSGLFFVPGQPMSVPSPRGLISRDSCLQSDTRKSLGSARHVFEGLPARGEPSSALFENSKNLASSSFGLRPLDTGNIAEREEGVRKELHNRSTPTPRFASTFTTWNLLHRTGGTYSQNEMEEKPRNQISELHFVEFPDSSDFQCWKVNFKTEVCSNSGYLTIAMLGIKEEEIAKSVDDLLTSQSIEGRDFPDLKMLDAKIAFAFKRIYISRQQFRRRVCVEEQTAQKYDRIPRGRQIAFFYDHFRATGAHDAAVDLSDLFNVSLQGDDIQDFDTRWDRASFNCQ